MATAPAVEVEIVQAAAQARPSAWQLAFTVRNPGAASAWIVAQESLALHQAPDRIELSYARSPMRPGVQVFGYFPPAAVELTAGASLRRQVDVHWPCVLSDIWNAARLASPAPGWYQVAVRIGYADTPTPPPAQPGEDIAAPVWRWQHEAVSAPVRLQVFAY